MPFFRDDNDDHRQFADAYCNGNCDRLPREQVARGLQDYVQNAPRQEVQEVEREYFQQMPQAQRVGLFDNLLGMVGTDRAREQAGVTTTDPRQASANDLSRLFGFAMNSGLLNGLMGGGQSRSQGGLFGGGQATPQQPQSQGGLGGLLGGLLGEDDDRGRQQQTDPRYGSGSQNQPLAGGRAGDIMSFLNNPLVMGALSGLMGYAANRFLNSRNQPQQQQPRFDEPQQSLGGESSLQGGRSEII